MQNASHATGHTAQSVIATQSAPDYTPTDALTPNTEDMRTHLDFLFGGELDGHHDGLIEIAWTVSLNGKHKLSKAELFGTDQIDAAVEKAASVNAAGSNVYVGAALRKPGTFPGARASDSNVLCTTCAWVDCDNPGVATRAKLKWGDVAPSMFTITGMHPHSRAQMWWRLKVPLLDHQRIEALQRQLAGAFDGDPVVTNPSRVMRLAGSIAHAAKPGRVDEMTRIQPLNRPGAANYMVEQLEKAFATAPAALTLAPATAPAVPPSYEHAQSPRLTGTSSIVRAENSLGMKVGPITDGREDAMYKMVFACLCDLIDTHDKAPTPEELCEFMWPQWEAAADLTRPGRGRDEVLAKCRSTVAKFNRGEIRGAGTIEEAKEGHRREKLKKNGTATQLADGPLSATVAAGEVELVRDPGPFAATDFKGTPPPRTWVVPDWIPAGTVTSLYGDGGTGKSLVALQLMYAAATSTKWLGLPVSKMRSLGVFCEDDREELWRRHECVASAAGHTIGNPYGDAILWPRTGHDNLLVTFDSKGAPSRTPFFDLLLEQVIAKRTELLILDTAADTFGGNEIIRAQVNHFIKAVCGRFILAAAAHGVTLTVLLLAHPSVAGLNSGSGTSGSTGWSNAVRSRLYLDKPKGVMPNERVLTRMKANYASAGPGERIDLLWLDGVLVVPFDKDSPDERIAIESAKTHILRMVRAGWDSGNPYKAKDGEAGRSLDKCMLDELGRMGVASHAINAALRKLKDSGLLVMGRKHRNRGWAVANESGGEPE